MEPSRFSDGVRSVLRSLSRGLGRASNPFSLCYTPAEC
jgi:hypothetical protein